MKPIVWCSAAIQQLRRADRMAGRTRREWPVHWAMDESKPASFRFSGYAAKYSQSELGNYTRLSYDRNQPWEREIAYYDSFPADIVVATPRAYVVPQAWREAVERLQWNGVAMRQLEADELREVQYYHIKSVDSRPGAYEGHMFHDGVQLEKRTAQVLLRAGDWWIDLDQDQARYVIETLEPEGHDSFFRWGFFNSVLEKKEAYSDYVFEDHAVELLRDEPALRVKFEAWKAAHPELLDKQVAVLDFIFANCQRYVEPEWRRYPVLSVL